MRHTFTQAVERRAILKTMLGGGLAATTLGKAWADSWPSRAVTFVVPYSAGASNDIFTRVLCKVLGKKFSQPFVVENRGGATGLVGSDQVARSAPDGYTFLESANSIAGFKTVLHFDLDPTTDLQAVALLAKAPLGMVIPASLPVHTVQEFIDYA